MVCGQLREEGSSYGGGYVQELRRGGRGGGEKVVRGGGGEGEGTRKGVLLLFMLWNICLMMQRCIALVYTAFV